MAAARTVHAAPGELEVRWEPFVGVAFDGSPLPGELGRVRVPERHARPDGPTIELAFVRYRTTHPRPGPPILFFAGGPGGSGIEGAAVVGTHPQIRLLEQADVIGIDQRGTGLSRPNLMEPEFGLRLPLDRAVDRADAIAALADAAGRCVAYWTERGVDLGAYDSVESADDADLVRSALGLDRIVTYGSSYGSHLALCYLRRHAEHVERALLLKVEGPNHTWKLPSTVQRHLERLHTEIAAGHALSQHLPDLLGTVRELLERLEREPVTALAGTGGPVRGGARPVRVTVGPHDLQVALARALGDTRSLASLPAALHRMSEGDWTRLAEAAAEERRAGVQALPLWMDCASGGTAQRLARIEREAADPSNLLGDAILAPYYPAGCEACDGDLGDAFRGPLRCDVPVLFVSGTLDVRTPPENVEEISAGFTDAAHVRVVNTGHDSRELMSDELRDLMQAFLRGEAVESCTIALPPVQFEPIGSGEQRAR